MRCSSLIFSNSNAVYLYSTGYPLDVNPGQPSKNQSTHTEDSITSSDTSIPPVADYAGTAPYPANSVAGHTVFEARPLDTQRSEK